MKDIPTAPPLPDAPPTQDFSKLGFVYITVLGLANQVVPHTGSWRPLATALNYLVFIAPIVYMAFQARPASPVRVQPDSSMSRDKSYNVRSKGGGSCIVGLIFVYHGTPMGQIHVLQEGLNTFHGCKRSFVRLKVQAKELVYLQSIQTCSVSFTGS
ncbi:hypothetical protein DSO57_1019184 [Entomophthora muscae]|uniref:Uncharacterized protein n=1 Tax=Entomophthora muscae TaxID=34485 RepID=A0ACC2SGU8_9FUNG|nr:hypothetical protein DSO57_1019184 [Entomophthora muscae]